MKNRPRPLGLILAGGESKRLFPVQKPKPLLKTNGTFLLKQALDRLKDFETYVIAKADLASQIEKDFSQEKLQIPQFIIEPDARDTAAASGFGLKTAKELKIDFPWVAILSADQWMPESNRFPEFLKKVEAEIEKHPSSLFVAGSAAESKKESSHSQFGWIQAEAREQDVSMKVKKFVEKPSGKILEEIRGSGLINAGMFFGKLNTFLEAYEKFFPDVLKSDSKYEKLEKLPIDRAIFEKFSGVRVIPLTLRWEDLGTWEDWMKNLGEGSGVRVKSENVFIQAESGVEVYAFDLRDIAIVQSGDKILVMPIEKTRNLKDYLGSISKK